MDKPKVDFKTLETITKKVLAYKPKKKQSTPQQRPKAE
jgi:hypothetical protein